MLLQPGTHRKLEHRHPGFHQFPDRSIPPRIPVLRQEPQLFKIFQEHKKWGRILNVNTVGRLNEIIATNESPDFIRIAEAFHEKKIAKIADHVFANKDNTLFPNQFVNVRLRVESRRNVTLVPMAAIQRLYARSV